MLHRRCRRRKRSSISTTGPTISTQQCSNAFTRETGIKVRYDTFDSNDTLETKLLAGKSGYDVVVPTGYFLERQIKAGVFLKLDKSQTSKSCQPVAGDFSAARDLRPRQPIRRELHVGTTGFGYNVGKVKAALGDMPVDSWDIVFKPEMLARLKDCGVHMLDSADDILPAALRYLGLDPNTVNPADYEKAADLILKDQAERAEISFVRISQWRWRPAKSASWSGWSGDIKQAQKRAAEAKNGVTVGYAIPKEGAQMFFDNLAIPKDARNVKEAHALINYLLRPDVAAKSTNFLGYANGDTPDPAIN